MALWVWLNYRALAWNWPVIGMLPTLLLHVSRVHDKCTEIMGKSRRGTFHFRGPWLADMDMMGTADPENVHYIMSANFQNFPKGPKFREIFDVLGDGIFNADSESWRDQRRVARALISHQGFLRFLANISREKVEKGLIPVLETVCLENLVVDLQDLFQRLTLIYNLYICYRL
ncbi:UNVERIFIED_CONTAM: Alkane hydroxylase MAH1 [Sesamum angustifolium]|uniref:Alkane hydroxylase MAH1 n=1 Tax=Sesamum angustifolium TaxID=2727405 RepID=A0AAW2RN39_9LAMI